MLPAEIAQAVKRIQFVTGRQVSDVMAGAYLSVFKGRGMEFDEVRPYVPGDDVRTIDWNVTARTGEPHVKRFHEERELTVMLLVDVSASQDFGSGRRSKLEAAVELSALLALSATENADARRSTSISAALEFCRQVLPRRAVLFLISDFMDENYIQVLRHANRKHD